MIVNVGFLAVISDFRILTVVVRMRQAGVVVLVGVPVRSVLPLGQRPASVMVRDVVVVMAVAQGLMSVLGRLAITFSALLLHRAPPTIDSVLGVRLDPF